MAYLVISPGSCGEFIQGYANVYSFMVTCPINRYSYAYSGFDGTGDILPDKAAEAVKRTLVYLKRPDTIVPIRLKSYIPRGKGLASSTADISAVCQATALSVGEILSPRELATIALSIEPSDATFFEGIVEFDYRDGKVIREMGHCPDMQILIYDCGGEVDTMSFNNRKDLISLQKSNQTEIEKAMSFLVEGLKNQSLEVIGKAATISAFANQKILFKKPLEDFYTRGSALGGKGVICAHSGTVLGLIVAPGADIEAIRTKIKDYDLGVFYLDTVRLTNQGMQIRKCKLDDPFTK